MEEQENSGILIQIQFFWHNNAKDFDYSFADGTSNMVTQKQLKADNISFISKNEYENLDNCLICNISFKMFGSVSQHHWYHPNIQLRISQCDRFIIIIVISPKKHRACGASVCGPCSRREINSQRVCDLCFFRCFLKKTEQRRKEQLETKKKSIQQLKNSQETIKKEIQKVDEEITNIKENKFKELEQLKKTLQIKKDELYDSGKELTQHEQTLTTAEIQLKEEKQRQQDLEKQQITSVSQLKGLQTELEQKKKIVEQKQSQVKNLLDQKKQLTATKSFLNYKQNKDATYNESDEEGENENNSHFVDNNANHEINKSSTPTTPANHYRSSSIVQNPAKNYEINQKQASNDKCNCSIF